MKISAEQLHLIFVGLLWAGAVPVLAYSYFKVSKWRKPLYLLALPIVAALGFVYVIQFIRSFGLSPINGEDLGLLVRVVLFLLSLLFYLVPYVDRLEARTKASVQQILSETDGVQDKLRRDQQIVMDDQRVVMDDQRTVMDDQRHALDDDQARKDRHNDLK